MFNRIMLATDDLDHAQEAAKMAGDAARQLHASNLCIVVAYPPVPEFLGTPEADRQTAARLTEAEALAERLVHDVGVLPCEIQMELLEGSVADAAMAASSIRESDLIILSARRTSLWQRLAAWLRNGRVMSQAHCPVLFVQ